LLAIFADQSIPAKLVRYGLLAALLSLLFFIQFDTTYSLLINALIDATHVVVFFVAGWVFFPLISGSTTRRVITLFLITVIASFAIEVIQETVGRAFQWSDIARNLLGIAMSLALRTKSNACTKSTKVIANSFVVALIFVFLFAHITLGRLIAAQIYLYTNSPVLADFNYPFETAVWQPDNAKISLTNGKLQVATVSGKKYAGTVFQDFPADWSEYQQLHVNIENLQPQPLLLTIKITDSHHDQGIQHYDERFNQSLTLAPGANHYYFSLETIHAAPKNRVLDLTEVSKISFFLNKLSKGERFLIDDIYLQ